VSYTYLGNSRLVSQISLKQNTTSRMVVSRQFDYLDRLLQVSSVPQGANQLPWVQGYGLNAASQRIRLNLSDSSYWVYHYDSLGQVTSGKRYWSDGTPVAGEQFGYGFDDIGNRRNAKAGGDQNGANLRLANYTPNNLNQYTQRDVPGAADLMGIASAAALVSVNGDTNVYRHSEYFRKEVSVNNASAAQYPVMVVVATNPGSSTTTTGAVFVARTPEAFTYDLDGNLLSDGRWNYTWDGENRLLKVESLGSAPTGSKRRSVFEYDWQGRRIRKQFFTSSGGWQEQSDLVFLYDGWSLMGELDANNSNAKVRTYVWGTDLSGSMHQPSPGGFGSAGGAGGVGGLLKLQRQQTTDLETSVFPVPQTGMRRFPTGIPNTRMRGRPFSKERRPKQKRYVRMKHAVVNK